MNDLRIQDPDGDEMLLEGFGKDRVDFSIFGPRVDVAFFATRESARLVRDWINDWLEGK